MCSPSPGKDIHPPLRGRYVKRNFRLTDTMPLVVAGLCQLLPQGSHMDTLLYNLVIFALVVGAIVGAGALLDGIGDRFREKPWERAWREVREREGKQKGS